MKTCKEMAIGICGSDIEAKKELEKMMGCKVHEMTDEQKELGVSVLCAFENYWRNREISNDMQ